VLTQFWTTQYHSKILHVALEINWPHIWHKSVFTSLVLKIFPFTLHADKFDSDKVHKRNSTFHLWLLCKLLLVNVRHNTEQATNISEIQRQTKTHNNQSMFHLNILWHHVTKQTVHLLIYFCFQVEFWLADVICRYSGLQLNDVVGMYIIRENIKA